MSFISSFKLTKNLYERCTLLSTRRIHTSMFTCKKDDGEVNGKPSAIDELIGNKGGDTKNEKTLNSLVKSLKHQNSQKRMNKMRKNLEQFDKLNIKKGEEFWFPEPIQESRISRTEVSMEHIGENEGNIQEKEPRTEPKHEKISDRDIPVLPTEQERFEMDKLKQQIDQENDNRSVSKLMSALIDDIDQNGEKSEKTFKKLLSAFGKNKIDKNTSQRKQSSFKKGKRTGTFFHEPTSLFGVYKLENGHTEESGFTSLHEMHWHEDLQNLLPEAIPENMFEVKLLDIDHEWKFPIDNEQDLGVEEVTSFEEHVFLDNYLDEFPDEGPVRKFMELVITGLQQNPYLSVEDKTNRIFWFKEYFEKFPEEELTISMEG